MSNDHGLEFGTIIDRFHVGDVVRALKRLDVTDKARLMLTAHASAPDRALSRYELALAGGGSSVNSANTVLGSFAKRLMLALDPQMEAIKESGGDYVMAVFHAPRRISEPVEGEPDNWVFVMSDRLAQALDRLGYAEYVPLSDAALAIWQRQPDGDDDDDDEGGDDGPFEDPLDDIAAARSAGELDELEETERDAVISARLGQGRFRQEVLARWDGRCAVTGAAVEQALVASHIKPWATASNVERLDPANGLLLVGTLDRLFDYGLISFDESGAIMISPRVSADEFDALHLSPSLRLRALPADTAAYLEYHRTEYYLTADVHEEDDE